MFALLKVDPPSEIHFKGPFANAVPGEVRLHNVSGKPVSFKIKTTAPKQYCVRPNCGLIEQGTSVVISVVLQPFELNIKEKIKHKFLILCMQVPDGPFESVEQLWREPSLEKVCKVKLRSILEFSNEEIAAATADSGTGHETQKLFDENHYLKEERNRLRRLTFEMSAPPPAPLPHVPPPPPPSSRIGFFAMGLIAVIAIVTGLLLAKFVV